MNTLLKTAQYAWVSWYYFFGHAPTHIGSNVLLAILIYCLIYKLYAPKPLKGASHA